MIYYWPAPLDLIDPSFNFEQEVGCFGMRQQQQQLLPHEILGADVYQGILISGAHLQKGNLRWNSSQLNRLLREGAKRFLRVDKNNAIRIMGDSGAYSIDSLFESTRKSVDHCLHIFNLYDAIGVDFGLAPDRIISGIQSAEGKQKQQEPPNEWRQRWLETQQLAESFLSIHKRRKPDWEPVGVAQGWDVASYQLSVTNLEQMGYSYIALGGLNSLQTGKILECVAACSGVKKITTRLHLLGISRLECAQQFSAYGVTSFDSATPIRQAIKDRIDNYHGFDRNYMAIKLPQTKNSPRLQKLMAQDSLLSKRLLQVEQDSLTILREYDQGRGSVETVLACLKQGAWLRQEEDNTEAYRQLLVDRPWQDCACPICQQTGIEIMLLRNRERNLRRGFHNLHIFSAKMRALFPHT
jgi:queuine/archaeosine tRNA-ribosyltransferase